MAHSTYKAKEFKLSGLKGISDETLKMHFGLYEGYVKIPTYSTSKLLKSSATKRRQEKTRLTPS